MLTSSTQFVLNYFQLLWNYTNLMIEWMNNRINSINSLSLDFIVFLSQSGFSMEGLGLRARRSWCDIVGWNGDGMAIETWKLLQLQVGGLSQCLFNLEEKSFPADRLQLVSQECDSYLYIGWWTRLVSVGVVQTLLSLLDIVFIMISPLQYTLYSIQYTLIRTL